MNDPLGLGGFNTQALHTPTAPPVAKQKSGGLLAHIASALVQAPKYFANNVVGSIKESAGELSGNKQAYQNAFNAEGKNLAGANNKTAGGALKTLAGNTAQLGGALIAPADAGLVSKVVAGARGGALAGGGSALSNHQDIVKGALEGAAGGAAIPLAIPAISKTIGIGGKAALTGKVGSTATDISSGAPKPTIGQKLTSAVVNKGNKIEAKLGSFAPGQKVGGQQLDTQASNDILNTLHNEGINKLSAPDQLKQVEGKINDLGQTHGTLTDTHNVPLTDQDKQAITTEVNNRLTDPNNPKFQAGGSSPTVQKYVQNYSNDINNADDLGALSRQKTGLDNNEINYKSSGDAATNARNIAAKTTRNVINDFMNSKVPGLDAVNGRLSNLYNAKGALMNASGSLANKVTGSEGITGRILTSETAEQAKGALAKGLQKTGTALGGKSVTEPIAPEVLSGSSDLAAEPAGASATGSTPAISPKLAAEGGRLPTTASSSMKKLINSTPVQGATRLGVAGTAGQSNPTPPGLPPLPPNVSQFGTSSLNTTPGGGGTSQGASSSQYPEENMLYDIERDPKNASTYEALFKIINPTPSATSLDNLTTNQKNQLTGSQNAISALQGYMDQINNVQGTGGTETGVVGGRVGTILGKLGLGGQKAANTYALSSSLSDVATQIAAGLSPTGRATSYLISEVKQSLPKVTDSQKVAQAKTSQLIQRLQEVMQTEATPLSTYVGNSAGGGDVGSQLQDLLATTGQQ